MPAPIRREPRYPVALPAALTAAGAFTDCVTSDVSFEGVFVETDRASLAGSPESGPPSSRPRALKLGELVRLTLLVPPQASALEVTGVVVHMERRGTGLGAGLRFYGMGGPARAQWDRFIGGLRDQFPRMTGRAVRLPRGEHFEPKLYRNEHQRAVLRVYVRSVAELYAMTEPEVDHMFVLTDEPLGVGAELGLQLVHPDSDDIFELEAFVTRVVDQQGVRGLDTEFLDLDAEKKQRLREFIDDGLEALFDEETLVDENPREVSDEAEMEAWGIERSSNT